MACPDQIDTEYHKQLIAIISSLPLQDGADIKLLTVKLGDYIQHFKDSHKYRILFKNKTNVKKYNDISLAVGRLKNTLYKFKDDNPELSEILQDKVNHTFREVRGNNTPSKTEIFELLNIIEQSSSFLAAFIPDNPPTVAELKIDTKFSGWGNEYDNFGKLYREATGKLGRGVNDGTCYGPFIDYLTKVYSLAKIEASPENTGKEIIQRLKL